MTLSQMIKAWRLKNYARKLKADCEQAAMFDGVVRAVIQNPKFSLVQKFPEIRGFMTDVAALNPRYVCDIGSSGGGTIRLFSHIACDDARIISLDINNTTVRQAAFPSLLRAKQRVDVLNASSYAPETVENVKSLLSGALLDVLFIDGDHTYEGVSQDFKLYEPLVRPGGIIGFHDIVEDYQTRHGQKTAAWVGDVPRFWRDIKPRFKSTYEFIEDPNQDGFGIGVIVK